MGGELQWLVLRVIVCDNVGLIFGEALRVWFGTIAANAVTILLGMTIGIKVELCVGNDLRDCVEMCGLYLESVVGAAVGLFVCELVGNKVGIVVGRFHGKLVDMGDGEPLGFLLGHGLDVGVEHNVGELFGSLVAVGILLEMTVDVKVCVFVDNDARNWNGEIVGLYGGPIVGKAVGYMICEIVGK